MRWVLITLLTLLLVTPANTSSAQGWTVEPVAGEDGSAVEGDGPIATESGDRAQIFQNTGRTFGVTVGEDAFWDVNAYNALGAHDLADRYIRRRKTKPILIAVGVLATGASIVGGFVWLVAGFAGYDRYDEWAYWGPGIFGVFVGGVITSGYGLLMSHHPLMPHERMRLVDEFNGSVR